MGTEPITDIDHLDEHGQLLPMAKLSREVRAMAADLQHGQVRGMVDLYYRLQHDRIDLNGQVRSLSADGRPHDLAAHFAAQVGSLEKQMVSILDVYSTTTAAGRWARAQYGIGPITTAGLMAHIDISRAATAGAIWRFAGLDPSIRWGKGEKRPYNAKLKTLCWKISDSFVKFSGREACFYGKLYLQRKEYELNRDAEGGNAETADQTLSERNFRDADTIATYRSGHLPAGRLDLRARRWAVKIFLSHWWEVAYEDYHGTEPPKPFSIAHLGHVHRIERPAG